MEQPINQELVYNEMKLDSDCKHEWQELSELQFQLLNVRCVKCSVEGIGDKIIKNNVVVIEVLEFPPVPDLTSPDGAFWLMCRLEYWDKFDEFCDGWADAMGWLLPRTEPYGGRLKSWTIKNVLLCLGMCIPGDNKAPALFRDICVFMGLEECR